MPPLLLERNVYPDDLFTEKPVGQDAGRSWWVIHTKPRQEKSLTRELIPARVPFYLPLVSRRSVVRGRVLEAFIPLFTSYLFLYGDHDDRIKALTTKRAVRSLEVADQGKMWHDLSQIHRLIAAGAPVTLEDRLEPGDPVRIVSGSLAGLEGKVIRRAAERRFLVQVDFIQQGASVLLEDFHLVAIEGVAEGSGEWDGTGSSRREFQPSS